MSTAPMVGGPCTCGHDWAHHDNDEKCWGQVGREPYAMACACHHFIDARTD